MVRTDCDYIGKARQHGMDSGLERPHAVGARVAECHRLAVRVSDKAGVQNTGMPKTKTTKKYPETQHNAGVQVAHNRLLPDESRGGEAADPARLVRFT
jgi:hypothetical protein